MIPLCNQNKTELQQMQNLIEVNQEDYNNYKNLTHAFTSTSYVLTDKPAGWYRFGYTYQNHITLATLYFGAHTSLQCRMAEYRVTGIKMNIGLSQLTYGINTTQGTPLVDKLRVYCKAYFNNYIDFHITQVFYNDLSPRVTVAMSGINAWVYQTLQEAATLDGYNATEYSLPVS